MPDYKLALVLDARANERYEEAHGLLLDCFLSATDRRDASVLANALLVLADNVLEWCPSGSDPFESRKVAAEEALKVFQEFGDRKGEARALLILASVDQDRARELDDAALAIGRRIADSGIVADALAHIAVSANLDGQAELARSTVREAIAWANRSGDSELLADTIFVLGTIECGEDRLGAFQRMASFESRYRRRRRFARRLSVAASLVSEDYPARAAEWFNRCVAIARELSDATMEGGSLHGLANIERALGNEAKADELKALANAMCPLPDTTELIKAAEAHDVRSVEQELRAMFIEKNPPTSQED